MQTTSAAPDLGCASDCIILGEHATCQGRLSWIEEHQTNEENAPCPAAHVVVMSQCETCGTCLFRDVVCATQQGVSKSLGEDTFMYRKYSEVPADASRGVRPRSLPVLAAVGAGLVSLLAAVGVSLRRRRWRRGETAVVDVEGSSIWGAEE